MKDDPNSLARRNALKRIGVTAVTGLSLALHPSSEAGLRKVPGVKTEQPAKKDDQPAKKDDQLKKKEDQPKKKEDTSKKKPIAELLPPQKVNLLTSKAKTLTRDDLLALGKGERTTATASFAVKDFDSIKTAFGPGYRKYLAPHSPDPSPGCCCCCSCTDHAQG